MKKKSISSKLLSVLLGVVMASTLLAGCGGDGGAQEAPAETGGESETGEAGEAAPAAESSGEGSVYLLNFKPETDTAWQNLAASYTKETGVPVTVLTAAAGQYSTTQQAEMAKSEAPTIFNVGNVDAAQTWNDYTLDLRDTWLYDHLTDKSLVIEYDGKVAAVANCYECFGIIYNKTVINNYATLPNAVISDASDIKDFATLKAVAEDINARVDEINEAFDYELTGAFASSGLDNGSSWRFSGHLACLPLYYEFKDDGCDLIAGEAEIDGTYLDQYKAVWDMYIGTSSADPKVLAGGGYNAEMEFGMREAVFYQNGDWEYSPLTSDENGYIVAEEGDELGMLPIYFGVDDENQGLCVGTENYWAVNSKAPQEDIDATLAFLEWVLSSDEGRGAIVNDMGLAAPFDTFTGDYAPANVFRQDNDAYVAAGKTSVAWSFNATPNVDDWRAGVVAPLTAYTDGTGDWAAVEEGFVTGWADQWKLAHE